MALCVYELIKFIKKFKKFTHVLFVLLHRCIKFHVKTHYILSIKKRFLTTYSSENLSFLLFIHYYEFELKILYTMK
jgi:hypothetical protein